jgi:hypothetical protein
MKRKLQTKLLMLVALIGFTALSAIAQVTTSAITGKIVDEKNQSVPGATITAVHTPSGTNYATNTNLDGRFTIPGMRIGGPYTIKVKLIGYSEKTFNNVNLTLGNVFTIDAKLEVSNTELAEVKVVGQGAGDIINSDRTGAATNISRDVINSLPTISRTINDFTRLTPQANGTSFGGQDNRLNNITVDGSLFNSSFGLSGQVGGRTGVSPISLDAIDQIQVNIAPFDVRQSGFVGAAVNAVTKSGTNEFTGSAFYLFQNQDYVGVRAKGNDLNRGVFDNKQYGVSIGGPIIKNKLFFFINAEKQSNDSPASGFVAAKAGQTAGGNISSVTENDLNTVSAALAGLGYQTGAYQGYNFQTKADRFLARIDYNINNKNNFSLRYNYLNSSDDKSVSNSSSLGFGSRFNSSRSISFKNSNYLQFEKVNSVIGELNSRISNKFSNNLILGYTFQNEDRGSAGGLFPLIEIQNSNSTAITAGTEPFTPSNRLNYSTYQLQNNLTYYANKHTLTAGISVERLKFENSFFPGSQSVYVFNSLTDFNTAISQYNANPGANAAVGYTLKRFQLRFSALPGGADPIQPTKVTYAGVYGQDEFQVKQNLKLTGGIRIDIPYFGDTGFENPNVTPLTFKRGDGSSINVSTSKLPNAKALFSPRIGFNWDVNNDRDFQIRGGSGIFTGRPAFVWISNQIGNNGVLTGFESIDNTTTRPFNPDPAKYIPANPAAGLPTTYEINITDPNFKFPQTWKTDLAIDKKLFAGLVGTLEFVYGKEVNAIKYENINLQPSVATFGGVDNRPKFPGYGLSSTAFNNASRINGNITSAYYLTNTNSGRSYSSTIAIERPYSKGWFFKAAYTYGDSKNIVNAGSNASGSFNNNPTVGTPNNAPLAYTDNDLRNRIFSAVSYKKDYKYGSTSVSMFFEAKNQGNYNYIYSADYDGDGNRNDLIFIPNKGSDLIFTPKTQTIGGATVTYTPAQQAAFFDAYISQDKYLREHKGQYAERNGALFPWTYRADLSITQEFKVKAAGKSNRFQVRADILNVGNFLNKDWGVGKFVNQTQILSPSGIDTTTGARTFTYNNFQNGIPVLTTYGDASSIGFDTYRAQLTFRYIFN